MTLSFSSSRTRTRRSPTRTGDTSRATRTFANAAARCLAMLCLGALAAVSCTSNAATDEVPREPPKPGDRAPGFGVRTLNAGAGPEERNLADYHGRPLLLAFWTTWSADSVQAHAHLAELRKAADAKALAIVAVSNESRDTVAQCPAIANASYEIAIDPSSEMVRNYGVRGFPAAILVSAEGVIVWRGKPQDLSRKMLNRFLAEGVAPATIEDPAKDAGRSPRSLLTNIRPSAPNTTLNIETSGAEDWFRVMARGARIDQIVQALLRVPPTRIRVAEELISQKYDVDVKYRPETPSPDGPELALRTLLAAAGLEMQLTNVESEVLVMTHSGRKPPRGAGGPQVLQFEGAIQIQNHTMAEIASILEELTRQPIVDQTRLRRRYQIQFPADLNAKQLFKHLEKEYGLSFKRKTLTIEVYHVRKRSTPATESESNQVRT